MTVESIDLVHTCSNVNISRKRNYRTSDICKVSEVLNAYQPTSKKEGNAKQFMRMTKAATGFTIKIGQATSAVRSKCNDSIEAQIGQYF